MGTLLHPLHLLGSELRGPRPPGEADSEGTCSLASWGGHPVIQGYPASQVTGPAAGASNSPHPTLSPLAGGLS